MNAVRSAAQYLGGRRRVVDVERGFFHLVQTDQLPLAQEILRHRIAEMDSNALVGSCSHDCADPRRYPFVSTTRPVNVAS